MPAYGYLQWGSCGNIINPQQTVDYLTVPGPQPTYPLDVQLGSAEVCEAAYQNIDGSFSPFIAPHIDPAPWYDPNLGDSVDTNPSAQFFGAIISKVEGLDSTVKREITERATGIGGGSFGPLKSGYRTLKFTATLYATSCRGMDYGFSWLAGMLRGRGCGDELCTLEVWTGCPDITTAGMDQRDSRWQFRDVSITEGPLYTDGPWDNNANCYLREITWTMASEQPYRYKCPIDRVARSALSMAPSGSIPICQWLSYQNQVTLTAQPSSLVGEDSLVIELTAGDRPLNCTISGWTSPFSDIGCSSFDIPRLDPYTSASSPTSGDLVPWTYEVAADGSWNRYDTNPNGDYVSYATAGTGVILGTTAALSGDKTTFRDIRIVAPAVAPSAYLANGLISAECFNNLVLVGGDLTVSHTVDSSTSSGSLRNVRHRGIKLRNFTGTAHIEGTRIHGTTLYEGIDAGSKYPSARLHLRNVRIEDVLYSGGDGGYGVRITDGLYALMVDGLSITNTARYGLVIRPTDALEGGTGLVQEAILNRFNASTDSASGTAHTLLHVGDHAVGSRRVPVKLVDVWIDSAYTGTDKVQAKTTTGVIDWTQSLDNYWRPYLSWPTSAGIAGNVYLGTPPSGDYVPASKTGGSFVTFPGIFGDPCASYSIEDLPAGYTLTIDAGTQTITVRDKSGVQKNGTPYVKVPDGKTYGWLVFDCNPMCVMIDQQQAYSGDGARVRVTQTYRELL